MHGEHPPGRLGQHASHFGGARQTGGGTGSYLHPDLYGESEQKRIGPAYSPCADNARAVSLNGSTRGQILRLPYCTMRQQRVHAPHTVHNLGDAEIHNQARQGERIWTRETIQLCH